MEKFQIFQSTNFILRDQTEYTLGDCCMGYKQNELIKFDSGKFRQLRLTFNLGYHLSKTGDNYFSGNGSWANCGGIFTIKNIIVNEFPEINNPSNIDYNIIDNVSDNTDECGTQVFIC